MSTTREQPEYRIWSAIKSRCHDPNFNRYQWYGARGITVCERWRSSYANFIADMGHRPNQNLILGRKNTKAGFNKQNCEWTTRRQQQNRTSRSMVVTFRGKCQSLADWCRELKVPYGRTRMRVYRGVEPIRALTEPRECYLYTPQGAKVKVR